MDLKLTTGCKLVLYADDIIVYKPIEKHEDYIDIQNDLDTLQAWSNSSRIMFNPQSVNTWISPGRGQTL